MTKREELVAYIKEHYGKETGKQIAKRFNVSESTVSMIAFRLKTQLREKEVKPTKKIATGNIYQSGNVTTHLSF